MIIKKNEMISDIISQKFKQSKDNSKINRNKNINEIIINKKIIGKQSKNNKKNKNNKNKNGNPSKIKKNNIKIKDKFCKTVQNNTQINKKNYDSKDSLSNKNIEKIFSSKIMLSVKGNVNNKTRNNNLTSIKEQYNDQELNTMDYKNAIKYDKRTYIQYYWSLLKKKTINYFHVYT